MYTPRDLVLFLLDHPSFQVSSEKAKRQKEAQHISKSAALGSGPRAKYIFSLSLMLFHSSPSHKSPLSRPLTHVSPSSHLFHTSALSFPLSASALSHHLSPLLSLMSLSHLSHISSLTSLSYFSHTSSLTTLLKLLSHIASHSSLAHTSNLLSCPLFRISSLTPLYFFFSLPALAYCIHYRASRAHAKSLPVLSAISILQTSLAPGCSVKAMQTSLPQRRALDILCSDADIQSRLAT